jgi:hypothetical protein
VLAVAVLADVKGDKDTLNDGWDNIQLWHMLHTICVLWTTHLLWW